MKERPILFSTPMVRAILEGRKTQTRRLLKPQPIGERLAMDFWEDGIVRNCPYGEPGDRLWVRETFRPVMPHYGASDELPDWVNYEYRADFSEFEDSPLMRAPLKWKPSIFMPREASRILLEITAVRVERLQGITEEEAKMEGVERNSLAPLFWKNYISGEWSFTSPVESFQTLWQSINGHNSWDENPWVWVIEFQKVKQ